MLNVLVLAPRDKGGPAAPLATALRRGGYTVACTTLDGGAESLTALCGLFLGRPPDVLLADLTQARDCLPLRHASRLLRDGWGDDVPLPTRLALFAAHHLALPDWPAYTDDFLLPPYPPEEMLARMTLLGFRKRHIQGGDTLRVAEVTVDLAGARALNGDRDSLPLTPREYELLRFLALHRGKFFARDRLLDMVWGVNFDGGERTVDIHVRRLRAKLPSGAAALLETRRGLGYGLTAGA